MIMMEMPSDMNGLLKSITRSRSEVMVIDAIAISDSRLINSPTMPSHPPATFGFSEPYFPSLTILSSSSKVLCEKKNKKEKSKLNIQLFTLLGAIWGGLAGRDNCNLQWRL